MGPMATAVYWIEYVIRHKGAPHMRSPASQLNFFTRTSFDVLVFLIIMSFAIWVIVKALIVRFILLVKMLFRIVFHKDSTTKEKAL